MASERVIGISLGTRKMGIAVVDRYSIFDCGVKAFQGVWSARKLQAILTVIEQHIVDYRIERVAIKLPTVSTLTPALTELLKGIEALARKRGISLSKYTLNTLKEVWNSNNRMNKAQLMQRVVEKYPELRNEYEREKKNKIRHYEKVFEAVGVTEVAFNYLS